MADDDDASEKGKKEKGGKSNLVPAVVLAVGIAVGGYFMGGSSDAPAGSTATTTVAVPVGEVATMDPISVNLADGHFLKVGVGVQLDEATPSAEFMKGPISRVKDLLIENLGGRNMADFATAPQREQIKNDLKDKAKKMFAGSVTDFYFTDFVMQ